MQQILPIKDVPTTQVNSSFCAISKSSSSDFHGCIDSSRALRRRLILRLGRFDSLICFFKDDSHRHDLMTFGQVTSTVGSGAGAINAIGGARALQLSAKLSF